MYVYIYRETAYIYICRYLYEGVISIYADMYTHVYIYTHLHIDIYRQYTYISMYAACICVYFCVCICRLISLSRKAQKPGQEAAAADFGTSDEAAAASGLGLGAYDSGSEATWPGLIDTHVCIMNVNTPLSLSLYISIYISLYIYI